MQENPAKMKQFVLSKISQLPQQAPTVVEVTELDSISCSPLKLRLPRNLLLRNISKGNVCVAGDALHPMTPDIGQGGCSALGEGVVLAWCLAEALLNKPRNEIQNEEEEYARIQKGLEKFAKERRWRSFSLISAAYVVGFIQERDGKNAIGVLENKEEDIVIVGAGMAGSTTALGLHRFQACCRFMGLVECDGRFSMLNYNLVLQFPPMSGQ
ncbi:hypothetical protein RHMOL_Rhmol06G0024700 [Rhododendron molle]|uniref:Uncharacterized protein n=1 Tax=Rhododendron molle TaxID=49168 RepID=A0ACC0N858_RHOML|nr:hypothetical protein RHMOL_Rhmol06G0024700 [Rhododendron molle]